MVDQQLYGVRLKRRVVRLKPDAAATVRLEPDTPIIVLARLRLRPSRGSTSPGRIV
jgi:hypothetical protein